MIKRMLYIILMILIIFNIAGCENAINQKPEIKTEEDKLQVYATIFPLYDFARQIGGDKIDVHLVVPPGAEPHDWEPSAKLVAQIEEADAFIYNGLDVDYWAIRIIDAVNSNNIAVVKATEGIELLEVDEHDDESHEHGVYDPHVWLDPIRALKEAETIKSALISIDEENQIFYESNFKIFSDKIMELDNMYREKLSNTTKKEIVVSHSAFGYLADKYGLEQIAISGMSPQEEPTASKIIEISKLMQQKKVEYVFFESLTDPKWPNVIVTEVGAQTAVLNPLGGITKEELDSGKDYFSIMEENLNVLVKALGD